MFTFYENVYRFRSVLRKQDFVLNDDASNICYVQLMNFFLFQEELVTLYLKGWEDPL